MSRGNKVARWTGVVVMLGTLPAQGQDQQLDQMVVTANKRKQLLTQVDAAVEVVTAEQLAKAGITQVNELEQLFPGLLIRNRGNRAYPSISMRGMASPNFYSPTVQLYLDGVPQEMAFLTQPLVNVARVELLKGPQGTLYGPNAYAGVLNIITHQPNEAKARLSATLANQKQIGQLSAASGKSAEGWYADISAYWQRDEGTVDDLSTGQGDIDDARDLSGRVRIGYAPEDSPLALELSASRDQLRSHEEVYIRETLLEQRDYESATQGPEGLLDRDVSSYAFKADYRFDSAKLTSITAWQDREMERYLSGLNYPEDQQGFSQELRLAFDGERTENLVGLYWQSQQFERQDPGFPSFFGPSVNELEKRSLALFGESRLMLTEQFDLTAGLRWSREHAEIDFQRSGDGAFTFDNQQSFSSLSPKLALGWQLDSNNRVYLSATKGYKPGGFNHAVSSLGDQVAYDAENSVSVELGWRSHFQPQGLTLTSALYWVDTQDKQLYVGPLGRQVLTNVGDSRSYGVEINAQWQPTDQLSLDLAAVFGHSELQNSIDPQTGESYSGNHLPYTPDTQIQLAVDYQVQQQWLPGSLSLQGSARYYSRMFFDQSSQLEQPAYTVVDASVQLDLDKDVQLRLFADNIADKTYRTSSFMFGPGDVRSTLGEGRVIGLSASVDF